MNNRKKYKFIIVLIVIISTIIFGCTNNNNNNNNNNLILNKISNNINGDDIISQKNYKKYFIVLPHHSLTSVALHDFYKKYNFTEKNIKNVVIISPNHYLDGNGYFESFLVDGKYCFGEKNCISGKKFDFYKLKKSNFTMFQLEKNKKFYSLIEHGIGEHFHYLNKYIKNSFNVFSVILRIDAIDLDKTNFIYNKLIDYNFDGNTLFIASVDFSHHVLDKIAIFHDMKTYDVLNNKNFSKVEVDCPNCLYLLKNLANKDNKQYFNIYNRTSATSIIGKNTNYSNTSHIFGEFLNNKNDNPNSIFDNLYEKTNYLSGTINTQTGAVYGMFFGDTHLTRGFLTKTSFQNKSKYLKCFYQNHDLNKMTKYWINRMFYSFDFVGVNLETSLCDKKYCVDSEKSIVFRTEPDYIKLFKNISINLFNLSNNHSYDCGRPCFDEGKKILKENNLLYFGDGRKNETNILKRNVNGLKIAFVGYNDTTFKWNIDDKINIIKKLKLDGYIIIVNIHWGLEYKEQHTAWQQKLAHLFVDNGVNMIIGHHPHVVEDYEIYKGVPIFYSLGNFIFDQSHENTLRGMGVVYKIDSSGVRFNRIYFKRKSDDYSIDCNSFE